MYSQDKKSGRSSYKQVTLYRKEQSYASLCVQCGKCEQHCPQAIPIREELKNAAKELETPVYKGMRFLLKRLKLFG